MDRDKSCFVLENVSVGYAPSQAAVLQNINLSIANGEKVAVIGPSGCGKSTLLKVLAGLKSISSGQFFYHGESLGGKEKSITLMLQKDGLLPWKNIADNVMLPLILTKISVKEAEKKAYTILQELGLKGQEKKYPAMLSGGQRQRAALARALISEPQVLLLDEPFSSLDAFMREQLQDILRLISKNRRYTAVLVTHSIEEAVYLGETIVIMNHTGEIVRVLKNRLTSAENMRESMSFYSFCREVRLIFEESV